MKYFVTKDSLKQLLEDPDKAFVEEVVGKALWAIFDYEDKTKELVFAPDDGKGGPVGAKYYKKHGHLGDCSCESRGFKHMPGDKNISTGRQWRVVRWLKEDKDGYPALCKYAEILNKIANTKAGTTNDS